VILGIQKVFSLTNDIEVIGIANNAKSAKEIIAREIPDVALIDINLPDIYGLELAHDLLQTSPICHIILMTGFDADLYLAEAFHIGVAGFFVKDSDLGLLCSMIRTVSKGGIAWDASSMHRAYQLISRIQTSKHEIKFGTQAVTSRFNKHEIEIIELVSSGLTNKQIANKMGYTEATIKKYLSSIMFNLAVHSRTRLAIAAFKLGLLPLQEEKSQPSAESC
jgi:DNA-binding NarL/FixJ family response regulator